jgi:hypothetical protein
MIENLIQKKELNGVKKPSEKGQETSSKLSRNVPGGAANQISKSHISNHHVKFEDTGAGSSFRR